MRWISINADRINKTCWIECFFLWGCNEIEVSILKNYHELLYYQMIVCQITDVCNIFISESLVLSVLAPHSTVFGIWRTANTDWLASLRLLANTDWHRETGVSRYHGAQLRAPRNPSKEPPFIMPNSVSLLNSRCKFFHSGFTPRGTLAFDFSAPSL